MSDCLIIGGGVIGLSLAYELAGEGLRVQVVDQGPAGRESSWAGAGILPPANRATAEHPYEQLCGLSHALHPVWAERLREETGIDTGFRRCGGMYLVGSAAEAAALLGAQAAWRDEQIRFTPLTAAEVAEFEPRLGDAVCTRRIVAACLLPDEWQLRNPWHVQALIAACRQRGVELREHCQVREIQAAGGRVRTVVTEQGALSADRYVLASGAWTYRLLGQMNIPSGIMPVRGQMVLYACPQPLLRHIVNLGPRYLVPREDGRLLVGSTEEEVGFDKRTTDEAITELTRLAVQLIPSLAATPIEATWAGLRPASFDGFPYLGRTPNLENLYVAAGHYRSGLFLSPATAVVMSQLIRGQQPDIDLQPFRVGRG